MAQLILDRFPGWARRRRAGVLALWRHVGRSVGFAWCGSAGAVSGHRSCPIFLAVALDAAHFSEDALSQLD